MAIVRIKVTPGSNNYELVPQYRLQGGQWVTQGSLPGDSTIIDVVVPGGGNYEIRVGSRSEFVNATRWSAALLVEVPQEDAREFKEASIGVEVASEISFTTMTSAVPYHELAAPVDVDVEVESEISFTTMSSEYPERGIVPPIQVDVNVSAAIKFLTPLTSEPPDEIPPEAPEIDIAVTGQTHSSIDISIEGAEQFESITPKYKVSSGESYTSKSAISQSLSTLARVENPSWSILCAVAIASANGESPTPVGTPVFPNFGTSATPSAVNLTVPSGCTGVLVFWDQYSSGQTCALNTATLAGQNPIASQDSSGVADNDFCGVRLFTGIAAGTRSLALTFNRGATHRIIGVVYLTGPVPTGFRAFTALSDGPNETSGKSSNLSTNRRDGVYKFDGRVSGTPSLSAGWTNLGTQTHIDYTCRMSYYIVPAITSYRYDDLEDDEEYNLKLTGTKNGVDTDSNVLTHSTDEQPISDFGFIAESGFAVNGDFVDGGTITITRSGGGFGTKPGGGKPLLYVPFASNATPDAAHSRLTSLPDLHSSFALNTSVKPPNAPASGRFLATTGAARPWNGDVVLSQPEVYVFEKVRYTHAQAENLKSLRVWNQGFTTSFVYNQGDGNQQGIYEADAVGSTTGNRYQWDINWKQNSWDTVEFIFRQSSLNTTDGIFNYIRNSGLGYPSSQRWRTRITGASGDLVRLYLDQYTINAGGQPQGTQYVYYDDLYVDDSLKRVFISPESSFNTTVGAETYKREICLPTSWANGSITCDLRFGEHASLHNLYLYVMVDAYTAIKVGRFVNN